MNNLTEEQKYNNAAEQVKIIKSFYIHLTVYVLVISFLIFINLKYSPNDIWFQWSAFGWGIGLISHSNKAFNWLPVFGKNWEAKKIEEIINNEKNRKNG